MSKLAPTQASLQEKHQQLQARLQSHGLDAYIIPPEDEHLNEYLAPHKKRVEWLTGFTGENAPVIVTPTQVYLFVDGRFFEQVDAEVDATLIHVHKLGQPTVLYPSEVLSTLEALASDTFCIGYDPFTVTADYQKSLQKHLSGKSQWKGVDGNLVDAVWTHRPEANTKPAFCLDLDCSGMTHAEKRDMLREMMALKAVDCLPVTRLDEMAWLFNLRGYDIPYNPVVEAYALLTTTTCILFIREGILPPAVSQALAEQGVMMKPYSDYSSDGLQALMQSLTPVPKTVWLDPGGMTLGSEKLFKGLSQHRSLHPITILKAIKNQNEQAGMAYANLQASIALIKHFAWASNAFDMGSQLSEVECRAHIEAAYKSRPGFHDLSFPTIPGIRANSAIIHYCEADPKQIANDGDWYLLDSGAHYMSGIAGTTDTTRTSVFGTPSQKQIDCYTAVLRAHIACAKQVFPDETTGIQLDAICRAPLWEAGLNFSHGTGHGVGAFLNVHEGPNRISPACKVKFEAGMVTSVEPGYYEPGWGGIRLENLYLVKDAPEVTPFMGKPWLRFESLTLVPFERKLINTAALGPSELAWLKAYYQRILDTCLHELNDTEQAWLTAQCEI